MEGMASAFSGLPYFSPMMMVNTSETCATRRLLQCRGLGLYENDVSRKFSRPWSRDAISDLSEVEFYGRKKVVDNVAKWWEDNGEQKFDEWVPILFRYEIVKMAAKRERDWGHLVFSDLTNTRFLLVMVMPEACNCGNLDHHDYNALTKYHANKFMCLLKGIFTSENPPNWVRATYVTAPSYEFPPGFLISTSSNVAESGSTIFHITPGDAVPTLLPTDIEKINNTLAQDKKGPIPDLIASQITGAKDSKPDVGRAWKGKQPRQCSYCEKAYDKNLMQCSRCKLVHYCSPECQKRAWPAHKVFCKKA